jgi:hypothetical protein
VSSGAPCDSRLDAELERLFDQDGDQSLKSCLKLITSPTTDPTALTGVEYRLESGKLLRGLLAREMESVGGYYRWRMIADRLSQILRMARREARGYRKRRGFKTGIKEIERRYNDRNKKKPAR